MGAELSARLVDLASSISTTTSQLVIFAMLFVLFCVWTVALARVWLGRRR
jgi:hypothetical protein